MKKLLIFFFMLVNVVMHSYLMSAEWSVPLNGYTGFITAASSQESDIQAVRNKEATALAIPDAQGLQPIHRAGKYCKPKVIDALVQKGISVNALTPSGQSPLMLALDTDPKERTPVSSGQFPTTVATLIGYDADVDVSVKGRANKLMSVRTYLITYDFEHLLTEGLQRKNNDRTAIIQILRTLARMPQRPADIIADYVIFLAPQDCALLKGQQQDWCVIS